MRIEITFGQLTAWLVAGVAEIVPSDFAPTPVEAVTDGLGSFSRIRLSVDLPEKYAAATSRPVIALADEIDNVTATTPELTREAGLRLANQGEGWVPVAYVDLPPTLPAEGKTEVILEADAQPTPLLAAPKSQVVLSGDAPTILAEIAIPTPRRKSRAKSGAEAAPASAKPKRAAKKRAPVAELPLDGGLGLKP